VSPRGLKEPRGCFVEKLTWAANAAPGAFAHMNTADTRLSLDGYRIQVLEKLKGSHSARGARDVLAEVEAVLAATGLSLRAQQAFWRRLAADLEVVAEESPGLLEKGRAARLAGVLAAAQADIARYLGILSSSLKS
jgi:hypothetical protein